MTTVIRADEAKMGDEVKITLRDNLKHFIVGRVIAIAKYDIAKSMNTDLAARHASIQSLSASTGDTLPAVTEETFLILDVGDVRPTVAAYDWIFSIELVEKGATFKIKLLNSSRAEADKAVAILRQNNIACQLDIVY